MREVPFCPTRIKCPNILSLSEVQSSNAGEAILQPGNFDGGKNPQDLAARFAKTSKLKKTDANLTDAAIAEVEPSIEADLQTIKGLGKLAGLGQDFVNVGTDLAKLGRNPGLTHSKVTDIELDNVVVGQYGLGNLRFDRVLRDIPSRLRFQIRFGIAILYAVESRHSPPMHS